MALRDYLNCSTRADLYTFVLAPDQIIAVVGAVTVGDQAIETWIFDPNSMAVDNGTTVIHPNAIPVGVSGRYHLTMLQGDWNVLFNKPTFSTVATSGDYNDLSNKPTIPNAQVQSDWNQASSGAIDFIKNKPTIPTNTNQLTNGSGYITGINSSDITTALGYTPVNPNGTSSQYIKGDGTKTTFPSINVYSAGTGLTKTGSEPSATFNVDSTVFMSVSAANSAIGTMQSDINGKVPNSRTLTINGSTQDLSANRTWTLNTSNISENTNLYYTDARSRASVSLTTTGTSGAATYNNSTGVLNIPNYTVSTPTINYNVSRSLNSNYTVSTTRASRLYYSINTNWSITALLSTASTVFLEVSTNGGTSWDIVNQVSKNVNLGLLQSGNDDLNVSGEVPANALVRLRTTSTNATLTYVKGTEVLI